MVDVCRFCGKPYPTVTIPGILGNPARTVQSMTCGCDGEREDAERRARESRSEALRRAWNATGVPERYKGVKPDRDGLERVSGADGLYFYGPRGTGKTRAACAVLKAYVAGNTDGDGVCRAAFVSVPEWLASLRGASWGEDEERAYNRAASRSLLVLDDLGKGGPTQWALERLFRLIDDRYNRMRPTVYTSQYGLGELAARLGRDDRETAEAIVSRIRETSTGVLMDGPDMRTKKVVDNGSSM